MANILFYDIETTPNLAYVWGKYQQDVIAFEHEWELLCFSYKWMGSRNTIVVGQDQFTEQELVEFMHRLFEEADIVIAHNGDNFDQRMMNAKFLQFGLNPPSHYKSVDTKKVAKKYFRFNSNKLDDLGNLLGLGRKVQTGGFELWMGCMRGDVKSWATMKTYNKQDVELLEKIYLKLRPWIDNHPSLAMLDNRPDACPKCGHEVLQSRGVRHTKVSTYTRYQCQGCGGWCQSRKAEKSEIKFTN